jgi:hypothetical protein
LCCKGNQNARIIQTLTAGIQNLDQEKRESVKFLDNNGKKNESIGTSAQKTLDS